MAGNNTQETWKLPVWLLVVFCVMAFALFLLGQNQDKAAPPGKKKSAPAVTPAAKLQPAPAGQTQPPVSGKEEDKSSKPGWITVGLFVIAFLSLLLNAIQLWKRKKITAAEEREKLKAQDQYAEEKQSKAAGTCRDKYETALKKELGHIGLMGSLDLGSHPVPLEETFVSLCISRSWRSDERFGPQYKENHAHAAMDRDAHLSPEQVMANVADTKRLLLVIGDPGSGKTTLMKYYAMSVLERQEEMVTKLGLPEDILPLYFPLRELVFQEDGQPAPLAENLSNWAKKRALTIPADQFQQWLETGPSLVLLDGLDEISSKELRSSVCGWIFGMWSGLDHARLVVTSRGTGYRRLDGVELGMPLLRADIMDFSPQQQREFLGKWFRAAYLSQAPPEKRCPEEWQREEEARAERQVLKVLAFLDKEESSTLRQLAAVPILLQLMAVLWKECGNLPASRPALYDAALNYLLEHRAGFKKLEPLLPADKSRRALAPTALWMQETLEVDEVEKEKLHQHIGKALGTLDNPPAAEDFCGFLRDRAGLLVDYDPTHYMFRHRSFREFLAGARMVKEAGQKGRLKKWISYLDNLDWWEETLRFFMSLSDEDIFDRFMAEVLRHPISRRLTDHQQNLLLQLIAGAPQKRVDALVKALRRTDLNRYQRRYVLDWLKAVGGPGALEALKTAHTKNWNPENRKRAEDILVEWGESLPRAAEITVPQPAGKFALESFRNPFEDGTEYIFIPGGTFPYSVTEKMETVPGFYLCKTLVTNKRYRRFIQYLEGSGKELENMLPLDEFAGAFLPFMQSLEGLDDVIGLDPKKWPEIFLPRFDNDKKFNGADQPVVGVKWYDARAYCYWLSCLEAAAAGKGLPGNPASFCLPTELEWEWAAFGEAEGPPREYPWPRENGKPHPNLANYNENVGTTTPVGRYPEGATPSGLMDMAGNAWEWMEDLYKTEEPYRTLRGGSWINYGSRLRRPSRLFIHPNNRYYDVGFRVLRPHKDGS